MTEISAEDAKRLGEQIEKLGRATAALDRDVRSLCRWLFPKEKIDEYNETNASVYEPVQSVVDLAERVQKHRRAIVHAEGRIGAMEALLRETLENVVSREEMKAHFKKHPPKRRGRDGF